MHKGTILTVLTGGTEYIGGRLLNALGKPRFSIPPALPGACISTRCIRSTNGLFAGMLRGIAARAEKSIA